MGERLICLRLIVCSFICYEDVQKRKLKLGLFVFSFFKKILVVLYSDSYFIIRAVNLMDI